jgi:hypothetical protein
MSHRSTVTFDTVCLILFVSCVLSFRLSLLWHETFSFCAQTPKWTDVLIAQSKRQLDRTDVSHTCSFRK